MASKQLWALTQPAKMVNITFISGSDHQGIFRIGVAVMTSPPALLKLKKTIWLALTADPAVFEDHDGAFYMYWGGIWGGQLQTGVMAI